MYTEYHATLKLLTMIVNSGNTEGREKSPLRQGVTRASPTRVYVIADYLKSTLA